MEDKDQVTEAKAQEAPQEPGYIRLTQAGGGWSLDSNIQNPERHLMVIGAQLTLKQHQ